MHQCNVPLVLLVAYLNVGIRMYHNCSIPSRTESYYKSVQLTI